jgi:hypothetical protein
VHAAAGAALKPATFVSLILPNFYGANYDLPDSYQFYLYGGILLVPLAIVGTFQKRIWLLLFVFFGIQAWFLVALGLALAAGAGAAWIADRFRKPWLAYAVLMLSVADLWYWNMGDNSLAYLGSSFAEKYGDPFASFESHLAPVKQRPLARIWSPFDTSAFGPLNGSLEGRTEVTYGYNALELARYHEYMHAAEQNPNLLNGLAVTHGIDTQRGAIIENTRALPRIYAPPQVKFVANHAAAVALLSTLDPGQWAVVETALRPLAPGPTAVEIIPAISTVRNIRLRSIACCASRFLITPAGQRRLTESPL